MTTCIRGKLWCRFRGLKEGARARRAGVALAVLAAAAVLGQAAAGCATAAGNIGLGVAGVAAYGGQAPTQELEQVYYLGTFDPQEQVDPAVYRLTVRGQGSAISGVKFASGWLPANFVDTLNSRVEFGKDGLTVENKAESGQQGAERGLATGRRLVMFGPEGFREAPKDHRLVIVMGSSPEKFFEAVGNVLGTVAQVQTEQRNSDASRKILAEMSRLQSEQARLQDLDASVKADLPEPK